LECGQQSREGRPQGGAQQALKQGDRHKTAQFANDTTYQRKEVHELSHVKTYIDPFFIERNVRNNSDS
jgi:hypothetical protein